MSPTTRHKSQNRSTRIQEKLDEALEQFRSWVPACGLSEEVRIKKIWDRLRALHYQAKRKDHNMEAFPYWMLRRLPERTIILAANEAFKMDLSRIRVLQTKLPLRFEVPEWHFVLFFGDLSQPDIKVIRAIRVARPKLSFLGLWHEVQAHRQRRLKRKIPLKGKRLHPWQFALGDFKACLKSNISQSVSGSDHDESGSGEENDSEGGNCHEIEMDDSDHDNNSDDGSFRYEDDSGSESRHETDGSDSDDDGGGDGGGDGLGNGARDELDGEDTPESAVLNTSELVVGYGEGSLPVESEGAALAETEVDTRSHTIVCRPRRTPSVTISNHSDIEDEALSPSGQVGLGSGEVLASESARTSGHPQLGESGVSSPWLSSHSRLSKHISSFNDQYSSAKQYFQLKKKELQDAKIAFEADQVTLQSSWQRLQTARESVKLVDRDAESKMKNLSRELRREVLATYTEGEADFISLLNSGAIDPEVEEHIRQDFNRMGQLMDKTSRRKRRGNGSAEVLDDAKKRVKVEEVVVEVDV
ncbi:hypothetical protein VFPPC_16478 [Pochonia chlamydosporia 170]|uniref:Uncharacterized protein n=1 Tax=Pochonia chlamydosporia 170 TaxID=1380566 RepID=A0A179FD78_METCM|nr:hypothetical protein VFPPC_16478 [Pochonia chlamydosporia 170]OAQ63454.1 hypothetical protein VFPPC_16478 [Pochonia chlamydosporia 170]